MSFDITGTLGPRMSNFGAMMYGAGAEFGTSVSLLNDIALVGAPRDNENDTHSGAAYVFRYNGSNWSPRSNDRRLRQCGVGLLGKCSCNLWGSRFDRGDRAMDDFGESSGAVYMFRHDGAAWIEAAIIQSYDVESIGQLWR